MKNFLTKKICFMALIWAMVISIFASSSHADCFMHPMGSLDSADIHNIIDISVDIRGSVKSEYNFLMRQGYFEAAKMLKKIKNISRQMRTAAKKGSLNSCSQIPKYYNDMDNMLMDAEAQLYMDGMCQKKIDRLINDIRDEIDELTHVVANAY